MAVQVVEAVTVAEGLSVLELVRLIESDNDSEELIEPLLVEVALMGADSANEGEAEGESEELLDPLALSEAENDIVIVALREEELVLLAVMEGERETVGDELGVEEAKLEPESELDCEQLGL